MLTDVQVKMDKEYLIISYNIDNFQDGVNIGINIFEKISKKLFTIKNDTMKGSFGIISPEEDHKIFIDLAFLPDDFNLEQYVCFPKLTFEGRIYYEMLKIPKGKHLAVIEDDLIEFERTGNFIFPNLKCQTNSLQHLSMMMVMRLKNIGWSKKE